VLSFPECPKWTNFLKINCDVGYLKEYLLEKLKIDTFESSRNKNAGVLHDGSVKIWRLGIGGMPVPLIGSDVKYGTGSTYLINIGTFSVRTFKARKGERI
jgi:hypothetical protein